MTTQQIALQPDIELIHGLIEFNSQGMYFLKLIKQKRRITKSDTSEVFKITIP